MPGHSYIWVFGITNEGRKIVTGPFQDKLEAQNAEEDLFEAQQYVLPTRDRTKAVRSIKQKLHQGGVPIDRALERVRNKPISIGSEEEESDEESFFGNLKNRVGQLKSRTSPEEEIFEGDPFKD